MTTFTYVTVSYCYVGVSYPVVGYADEGYWRVSYPVVGYGFVGVTYCYVGESYPVVTYGAVWRSEMWRRTHRWGLTRGVAVDRMEVQQRGKREKGNPNGHRNRLLRRARRLLHRRPGGRPGRLRRLTRRPPLRRGPRRRLGCPSEAREGPSGRRRRPRLGHPTCGAPEALRAASASSEGRPRRRGRPVRPRRRPRAITQRRCCENPGT